MTRGFYLAEDGEWDVEGETTGTLLGTAADPTEATSNVPARAFNIKPFIIIGIVVGIVLAVILAVVKANKKFGKGFD